MAKRVTQSDIDKARQEETVAQCAEIAAKQRGDMTAWSQARERRANAAMYVRHLEALLATQRERDAS